MTTIISTSNGLRHVGLSCSICQPYVKRQVAVKPKQLDYKAMYEDLKRKVSLEKAENKLEQIKKRTNKPKPKSPAIVIPVGDAVKISMSEVVSRDLAPVMLELTKAVKELSEFKKESTADAIEQIVTEFRESLTSQTNTEIQRLAQTLDETTSVITKIPQEFSSFMDKLSQSSIEHHRDLVETLEDNRTQDQSRNEVLQSNLTEFLGKMESLTQQQTGHIQQVADTMQKQLNNAIETFGNNIQKQSDTTTESIDSLLEHTSTWTQEFESRLNKLSEQSQTEISKVQDVLTRTESIIERSNQVLENASLSAIEKITIIG